MNEMGKEFQARMPQKGDGGRKEERDKIEGRENTMPRDLLAQVEQDLENLEEERRKAIEKNRGIFDKGLEEIGEAEGLSAEVKESLRARNEKSRKTIEREINVQFDLAKERLEELKERLIIMIQQTESRN